MTRKIYTEDFVQLCTRVPLGLWRRVKIRAVENETTLAKMVEDALREKLEAEAR